MNIIILGPQGSGKGTQAQNLIEKYDLKHIEMGLLLREMAQEDSPLGKEIDIIINEKKELAPDGIVFSVLQNAINHCPTEKGIIFDGVPRRKEQIETVEHILHTHDRSIDAVVYISLPFDESVERITKRFGCSKCKTRLILGKDIQSAGDLCPECGGEIMQRNDDTIEGVTKRLDIFYEQTIPVIEYYREKHKLIEVDGRGSVSEVYDKIVKSLQAYIL